MILSEGRSRRGPQQMSPMPDKALVDPERLIAYLQRQLAERKVEREEALPERAPLAEIVQIINRSRAAHCRARVAPPGLSALAGWCRRRLPSFSGQSEAPGN